MLVKDISTNIIISVAYIVDEQILWKRHKEINRTKLTLSKRPLIE